MKVHCRSLLPINKLSNERNHIQVTVGVLSLSMEAERAPQWVSAGAQWQHLLLRMGWGKGGWACDMPMPSGGKRILPGNHLVARLWNRLKLTHKKNGSVVQWAPQSLRSVILAVHNLNENGTNLETASDSSFLFSLSLLCEADPGPLPFLLLLISSLERSSIKKKYLSLLLLLICVCVCVYVHAGAHTMTCMWRARGQLSKVFTFCCGLWRWIQVVRLPRHVFSPDSEPPWRPTSLTIFTAFIGLKRIPNP